MRGVHSVALLRFRRVLVVALLDFVPAYPFVAFVKFVVALLPCRFFVESVIASSFLRSFGRIFRLCQGRSVAVASISLGSGSRIVSIVFAFLSRAIPAFVAFVASVARVDGAALSCIG